MRLTAPLLCVAVLAASPRSASAGPGLEQIQREFKTAIDKGTPATVSILARDSQFGCSGVMVSRSGLVLSDYDAGVVNRAKGDPGYSTEVRVRVPDMKTGAFVEYAARIVKVMQEVDSTLIQITKPPDGGFKYLVPASADGLRAGSFTFAAGNAFGMASESLPAMTAGVVTATTYLPRADRSAGRFEFLYTGAAVNPGVSGGPLLDVQGRLVGVIAGYEPVTPENPYQFLGKAIPIDRLRAAYAAVPEATDAFDEKSTPIRSDETSALEMVIARAAADAYPCVASLVMERSTPVDAMTRGMKEDVDLPRYRGPASAVTVSADGYLLTSLYNLTSVEALTVGVSRPERRVQAGLKAITGITAWFPDGSSGPAKVVATHEGLGIALLKAELAGRPVLTPAPASAYVPGRFLIPVANPFGAKIQPDPLLNFGVVSKRHGDDDSPWRGQLQTDAGGTDGNCGAAVVDIEGRLVGVMTLWRPIDHGRNSGIAFVVPWDRIEPVLARMKEGHSFRKPAIGIQWVENAKDFDTDRSAKVFKVHASSPADVAGMNDGDVIVKIGAIAVKTIADVTSALAGHYGGDRVVFVVSRDGQLVPLDIELGTRE